MRRAAATAALVAALCLPTAPAHPETLRVGPGHRLQQPSQAAAIARDGDHILIEAGRYRDCAVWRAARLRIEATGQGAVEISGPVCQGKALFVTVGAGIAIGGITFTGAAIAPDGNAAGIRAEGGDLLVSRSRFVGNQNGILVASATGATVTIEGSVFVANGALVGECAHAVYANRIAALVIRQSVFEATRTCHHVKSRAARTELVGNRFADGPDGDASYLVDLPNGGDLLLVDNDMAKGPRSANPSAAIVLGAEGVTLPTASLRIIGNRFENLQSRRTVFLRNRTSVPAQLEGNVLRGPVTPLEGPGALR